MRRFTFNASDQEADDLLAYCEATERSFSDVIRELIRERVAASTEQDQAKVSDGVVKTKTRR